MATSKQADGGKATESTGGIDISIPDAPDAKGGIEIEGKAGTAETLLLFAIQVRGTATKIAAEASDRIKAGQVVVIAGDPQLDLGLADQFDAACVALERQLGETLKPVTLPAAGNDAEAQSLAAGAALTSVGSILNAAAKVAQYFAVKTKFADVDIAPDDSLLALAVAGALLNQKAPPSVYLAPFETVEARNTVHKRVADLASKAGEALVAAQDRETKAASDEKNAALWTAAAEACRATAKGVSEFIARFAKEEKDGGLPIDKIIQQTALRTALDGGAFALFVKSHATGGSLRTKSGLFVGIGNDAPAAVGALLISSHALVDGQARTLTQANTHHFWSGYRALDNLIFLDDQPETNRYYNG